MFWWMIRQNKLRAQALKFQKEGNLAERDKIVKQKVPEWAQYCLDISGTTVEVRGKEKIPAGKAVVYIANHQGYFDIPSIYANLEQPISFISKKEVEMVPLIKDWMHFLECTFMDRKSPRKSIQAIHDAAANVKRGYSQVIFPEGTRSKGGPYNEFKAGSFKLAFLSEAPIVPVTIDGTYRVYEQKGKIVKGNHVILTIHDPIETKDLDRDQQAELPARIQEIICSILPPPEVTSR